MLAVTIMLDVAFHGGRETTVSAADMSERLGMARRGMESQLQALSRTGLLTSVRGPRGGYRLGRAAREIGLSEVMQACGPEALEPTDGPGGRLQGAVVDPLWNELDTMAEARLGGLTLEDLLKRASAAGLRRPSSEPISFAI